MSTHTTIGSPVSSADRRSSTWRRFRAGLQPTPAGWVWRKINRRRRLRWTSVQGNPRHVCPESSLHLFAILGTWMEEDIVAASVRNPREQGCEQVYLVDNDSPDSTIDVAVAAGATLAARFRTSDFDDTTRHQLMNEVMHRVSESVGAPRVWWLWLDADEFSHGPAGLTIRGYLELLDRRFRIVGARYFNHYPSGVPQYTPGRHPLDYQPLCEEYPEAFCPLGHRKHPLVRVDRARAPVSQGVGFHRAISRERLVEPETGLFLHHFPYRQEEVTRARLQRLCQGVDEVTPRVTSADVTRESAGANAVLREQNLNAVYTARWSMVREWRGPRLSGISPRPWASLVPPADQVIARWY